MALRVLAYGFFVPVLSCKAWDFGWHSGPVVFYRICSRGGCDAVPIADHGWIGLVVDSGLALFLAANALVCLWRFFTRYPEAIVMPDRLWLHPSYGRQALTFDNVADVGLIRDDAGVRSGQAVVVVDLIYPPRRNWLGRLLFWKPMTYRLNFSSMFVQRGALAIEAFHEQLVSRIETATSGGIST